MTAKSILAITAVLGLISFLLVALDCNLSSPWAFVGVQCSGMGAHWRAIAAFDIVTEVVTFGLVIFILYDVRLKIAKKLTVIFGFVFRLLLLPSIAVRLHYVLSSLNSTDVTLHLDTIVINTQVELLTAIITATIPCLRPFMAATYTTWGGRVDVVTGTGYQQQGNSSGQKGYSKSQDNKTVLSSIGSYTTKIGRSKNNTGDLTSQDDIPLKPVNNTWREDPQKWEDNTLEARNGDLNSCTTINRSGEEHTGTDVTGHVQEDQQSLDSHDSQKMIIRRDVEWNVSFEARSTDNSRHHD